MIEENITEKKLSDMVGCSKKLLIKWLNEEEEMPVLISDNIAKVLNIDTKISLNDLNTKFNKLSDENKNKVLEYIEFLQYKQNKVNNQKRLTLNS